MVTKIVVMVSVLAVLASTLQSSAAAQTVHVVGGATGWTVKSAGNSSFYADWAASQTFHVGDILVFNYSDNQHDVVRATKASYDACSTDCFPIIAIYSMPPPVNVTLDTPGKNYFICSIGNHCASGQKFSINVIGDSSTPPSPSPASNPESTPFPLLCRSPPPPPPGSAASPAIKGLSATFLSTLVAYYLLH